jgi:hypothetical protein
MGIQPADSAVRRLKQSSIIFVTARQLARQSYDVFGNPLVRPKDISTVSVRDLCLFIRATGLLNVY